MITGVVTDSHEAIIPLILRGPGDEEHTLHALIDTGFNGALTLPPKIVSSLGLERRGSDYATLADGSETLFSFYEAIVVWDGRRRRVVALATDGVPLVGMALLAGHELTIRAVAGGIVAISSLPRFPSRRPASRDGAQPGANRRPRDHHLRARDGARHRQAGRGERQPLLSAAGGHPPGDPGHPGSVPVDEGMVESPHGTGV